MNRRKTHSLFCCCLFICCLFLLFLYFIIITFFSTVCMCVLSCFNSFLQIPHLYGLFNHRHKRIEIVNYITIQTHNHSHMYIDTHTLSLTRAHSNWNCHQSNNIVRVYTVFFLRLNCCSSCSMEEPLKIRCSIDKIII